MKPEGALCAPFEKHMHLQTYTSKHTDTLSPCHTRQKHSNSNEVLSSISIYHFWYNLSSTYLCFTSKLNISSWRNRLEGCKFSFFVLLRFSPSVIQLPLDQTREEELEEMWTSTFLM